eukprot:gene4871-6825_t
MALSSFLIFVFVALVLSFDAVSSFGFVGKMKNTLTANSLVMRERKCDLSGTRRNSKCMSVSKSNAHTHRVQLVNLQVRKLWWEEGNKFVKLRVSARTLKTIQKNGLNATAKKFGIDLNQFSISSGTAVAADAKTLTSA